MSTVSDRPAEQTVKVVSARVESTLAAYRTARWTNDVALGATWGVAALATVAFVACMLDLAFGWLSPVPRWLMWSLAVTLTVWAVGRILARTWRVQSARPLVAAEADAAAPLLEERLQTVTFFADSSAAIGRADRRMLTQVAREADELAARVEPDALIDRSTFRTPLLVLAGVGVLFGGLWLATSARDATVLVGRFVAPWSSWTRTTIAAPLEADVVAIGEPWRFEVKTDGAPVSMWQLEERPLEPSETMPTALSQLRRTEGALGNELRYTRTNATDSFAYRITAGDYRSPWMTVTVASRPELVDASVRITPPAYTDWKPQDVAGWPRELKMLSGSVVDFAVIADIPETVAELRLTTGRDGATVGTRSLVPDGNGTLRGAVRVDQNQVATLILTEPNGLENARRYAVRLIANRDKAPVVKVKSPTPETTVRPDDTVTVKFEARDDVGIAYAELEVFETDAETLEQRTKAVIPIPVPEGKENRKLSGQASIDLSQFDLETGDTLDYRIRVFDKKQFAEATERPMSESNANRTGVSAEPMVPSEASKQDGGDGATRSPTDSRAAERSDRSTDSQDRPAGEPNLDEQSAASPDPEQMSPPSAASPSDGNETADSADQVRSNSADASADQSRTGDEAGTNDTPKSPAANMSPNDAHSGTAQDSASSQPPSDANNRSTDGTASDTPADQKDATGASPESSVDDAAVRVGDPSQPMENRDADSSTSGGNGDQSNAEPADSQASQSQSNSGGQNNPSASGSPNQSRPPASPDESSPNAQSGGSPMKGDFRSSLTPQPSDSQDAPNDSAETPDASEPVQNPPTDSGDMSRRMLDVNRKIDRESGSASNQMRLKIDENAGSFAGEARQKLEVAIEPVLSDLRAWLGASSQLDAAVISRSERGEPWGTSDEESINRSVAYLDRSIDRVSGLLEQTAETPYAFVGLQLGDIIDNQIKSARTDLLASLDADDTSRIPLVNTARVATEYAIKRLDDLTTSFERERREQEVADKVQELERMYQIFLEDTMASLGSAKNTLNNYDREMGEVDPDEEYLERLREVLQMREKLKAELASILAEDPRLLRRFTQQFIDKGDSLRDQVTLLHYRQRQIVELGTAQSEFAKQQPATGSASEDPAVEADGDGGLGSSVSPLVWNVHWENGFAVGAEVPGVAERFETWLPLTELPNDESLLAAREALKEATVAAAAFQQRIARFRTGESTDAGGSVDLRESLLTARDHLLTLGSTTERPDIANDALRRIVELDDVIEQLSAWTVKQQALEEGDVAIVLGIEQHRVLTDTRLMGDKLANLEQQLAALIPPRDGALPAHIAALSRRMLSALDNDVGGSQLAASFALRKGELEKGTQRASAANDAFETAEVAFDELMRAVIEILDEEPPGDPIAALLDDPTLEEILAALENETDLLEALGIPQRALNIQIINDWMSPAKNGGGGGGGGRSGMAGGAITQNAKQQQQRLQEFRQRLRQTLEQYDPKRQAGRAPDGPITRWGKVISQLEDGLLQDNADKVHERYRRPIEQYFEAIGRER